MVNKEVSQLYGTVETAEGLGTTLEHVRRIEKVFLGQMQALYL